ncbi:MAG: DUF721 domain-containing protein [Treponema sp.]|jgi:hypothetical protein|nr:DUF721 domain-containing protein [Treponema sp.]
MRKAGDILKELFRERFGEQFLEKGRSTAGLFSSWSGIVTDVWAKMERKAAESSESEGYVENDIPGAAVHSRIKELEHGVLFVEADHPGWIQILKSRQAELLLAVQTKYADLGIKSLAFRLSKEPFKKTV